MRLRRRQRETVVVDLQGPAGRWRWVIPAVSPAYTGMLTGTMWLWARRFART